MTHVEERQYIAKTAEELIKNVGRRKDIKIEYAVMTEAECESYGSFTCSRLGLRPREEYFLISDDNETLYAVNVSAESATGATASLFDRISLKQL